MSGSSHKVSGGNVFADLGVDAPEEALAKAELTAKISEIIAARGLTQLAAAKILDCHREGPQGRHERAGKGRPDKNGNHDKDQQQAKGLILGGGFVGRGSRKETKVGTVCSRWNRKNSGSWWKLPRRTVRFPPKTAWIFNMR